MNQGEHLKKTLHQTAGWNRRTRVFAAVLAAAMLLLSACGTKDSLESSVRKTSAYLIENADGYDAGTDASGWIVIGLAKAGEYCDDDARADAESEYYDNVRALAKSTNGELSKDQITVYERTVMALHAIGRNPADVEGHDLTKALDDRNTAVRQGLNAEIYALIAAGDLGIHLSNEEQYISDVRKSIKESGAVSAGGGGGVDLTAAAVQALSFYDKKSGVPDDIDRMMRYLSKEQQDSGSYDTCEETAQVIIALNMTGKKVDSAEDFIKHGKTLEDGLMSFRKGDGFSHDKDGDPDLMASNQALLAMDSILLAQDGGKLYGEDADDGDK